MDVLDAVEPVITLGGELPGSSAAAQDQEADQEAGPAKAQKKKKSKVPSYKILRALAFKVPAFAPILNSAKRLTSSQINSLFPRVTTGAMIFHRACAPNWVIRIHLKPLDFIIHTSWPRSVSTPSLLCRRTARKMD